MASAPTTLRNLYTCTGHGHVRDVAVTDDGKFIVSASRDRTVRVWDAGNGELVRTLIGHTNYIFTVVVFRSASAGNESLYTIASGSDDGTIKLWNLQTGELTASVDARGSVLSLAVWPDGSRLVAGHGTYIDKEHKSDVTVWSLQANGKGAQLQHVFKGHTAVRSVAVRGDLIVSGSEDNTVKVWSVSQNKVKHSLTGHTGTVYGVALHGDTVISASYDRTWRLWDVDSGQLKATHRTHHGLISLAVTGNRVVLGAMSGAILVCSLSTGKLLQEVPNAHSGWVRGLAIHGNTVVSASDDSTAKAWKIPSVSILRVKGLLSRQRAKELGDVRQPFVVQVINEAADLVPSDVLATVFTQWYGVLFAEVQVLSAADPRRRGTRAWAPGDGYEVFVREDQALQQPAKAYTLATQPLLPENRVVFVSAGHTLGDLQTALLREVGRTLGFDSDVKANTLPDAVVSECKDTYSLPHEDLTEVGTKVTIDDVKHCLDDIGKKQSDNMRPWYLDLSSCGLEDDHVREIAALIASKPALHIRVMDFSGNTDLSHFPLELLALSPHDTVMDLHRIDISNTGVRNIPSTEHANLVPLMKETRTGATSQSQVHVALIGDGGNGKTTLRKSTLLARNILDHKVYLPPDVAKWKDSHLRLWAKQEACLSDDDLEVLMDMESAHALATRDIDKLEDEIRWRVKQRKLTEDSFYNLKDKVTQLRKDAKYHKDHAGAIGFYARTRGIVHEPIKVPNKPTRVLFRNAGITLYTEVEDNSQLPASEEKDSGAPPTVDKIGTVDAPSTPPSTSDPALAPALSAIPSSAAQAGPPQSSTGSTLTSPGVKPEGEQKRPSQAVKIRMPPEVTLNVLDLAGQPQYYLNHEQVLPKNAVVYVLVQKVEFKPNNKQLDTAKMREVMRPWLTQLGRKGAQIPLLVVITHLDLPAYDRDSMDDGLRQDIAQELQPFVQDECFILFSAAQEEVVPLPKDASLLSLEAALVLIDYSNTQSCSSFSRALTDAALQEARGVVLPRAYDEALQATEQMHLGPTTAVKQAARRVVPYSEFRKQVASTHVRLQDYSAFEHCVEYMQGVGALRKVTLPQEAEPLVFLQPARWLSKVLSDIVEEFSLELQGYDINDHPGSAFVLHAELQQTLWKSVKRLNDRKLDDTLVTRLLGFLEASKLATPLTLGPDKQGYWVVPVLSKPPGCTMLKPQPSGNRLVLGRQARFQRNPPGLFSALQVEVMKALHDGRLLHTFSPVSHAAVTCKLRVQGQGGCDVFLFFEKDPQPTVNVVVLAPPEVTQKAPEVSPVVVRELMDIVFSLVLDTVPGQVQDIRALCPRCVVKDEPAFTPLACEVAISEHKSDADHPPRPVRVYRCHSDTHCLKCGNHSTVTQLNDGCVATDTQVMSDFMRPPEFQEFIAKCPQLSQQVVGFESGNANRNTFVGLQSPGNHCQMCVTTLLAERELDEAGRVAKAIGKLMFDVSTGSSAAKSLGKGLLGQLSAYLENVNADKDKLAARVSHNAILRIKGLLSKKRAKALGNPDPFVVCVVNEAHEHGVTDSDLKTAFTDWYELLHAKVEVRHVPLPNAYTIRVMFAPDLSNTSKCTVYAAGFYPTRSAHKRVIRIGAAFEGLVNKLGCLRHEVGHTLGFGHEDYALPDQSGVQGQTAADAILKRLSVPDAKSIMHSKKVFDDNDKETQSELSEVDKIACVATYDLPEDSEKVHDMEWATTTKKNTGKKKNMAKKKTKKKKRVIVTVGSGPPPPPPLGSPKQKKKKKKKKKTKQTQTKQEKT